MAVFEVEADRRGDGYGVHLAARGQLLDAREHLWDGELLRGGGDALRHRVAQRRDHDPVRDDGDGSSLMRRERRSLEDLDHVLRVGDADHGLRALLYALREMLDAEDVVGPGRTPVWDRLRPILALD